MPVYFQDRFIKDNLRYIKGDLLDLGCGDKPYRDLFDTVVKSHIGVDSCAEADVVMDAHKLSFDDGTFDTVLATSIIEHCEDPFRVVSEVYRVLKKDGHFIVSVPYIMFTHCEPRDFYRFTTYGLQYILKDFDIIKTQSIGGYWTANGYMLLQYIARFFDKIKVRCLLSILCVILQPIFILLDKLDNKSSHMMAQGYMAIAKKPI